MIKDVAIGKIVVYFVKKSLKIDFVLDTINQLNRKLLNDEAMIYSNQGVTIKVIIFNVIKYGITQYMSAVENVLTMHQLNLFLDILN